MRIFEGNHIVVFERDGWEFVERRRAKEAVAIVAVVDGRLILTEQYRRPVDARVIDLPAGLIEEFGPEETAKRELEEETGFTCDRLELIATSPTSPGITSEIVHFYRAQSAWRKGNGGGVSGEEIEVHLVPLDGIEKWLKSQQKLIDAKVWAGLYFAS
jgi:ADP-ribose pyrophosphatase